MMPKNRRLIVAALCLACCASALLEAQEPKTAAAAGAITPITGNLYGLSAGGQHTIFLVTADGIVLVDPLTRATVEWLTTELDQRFPKQPVRYVLATHFELARVEAISSFYQTADIVGHRAFNGRLSSARRASPDTHRFVRQVETEFSDRWTVTLGADIIDMIHVESERAPDLSVVYFRNERTVFSPYAVGTAVPFSFSGQRPSDVFNWLHTVSALDFDTVLFGDGQRATRTQITQLAEYLDAMRAEVAAEYERGYSLDEVQARVTLPSHERNPHYAGRQTQVASIYQALRLFRVEANGAGLAAMTPRDSPDYCEGSEICSSGGLLSAGTVGLAFWLNRRIAMSGEVTLGAQSWSTRLSPHYGEEVALRQSRSASFSTMHLA